MMQLVIVLTEEDGAMKIKLQTPDEKTIDVKPVKTDIAPENPQTMNGQTVTNGSTEPGVTTETVLPTETEKAALPAATATENTEAKTTAENEVNRFTEKIASLNREYERLRKAVWRMRKRLAEMLQAVEQNVASSNTGDPDAVPTNANVASANSIPAAVNDCPETIPAPCISVPSVVPDVPDDVPIVPDGPGNVPGDVGTEEKRKNQRKEEENKNKNNKTNRIIPAAKLPAAFRNVVNEWNRLPLRVKLKGLFPAAAKQVQLLLNQFGADAVQKAIRMVGECPFLLGTGEHSHGWVISFSWLLKPQNMEKVLNGRYRERTEAENYPEYIPWDEEENAGFAPRTETANENSSGATFPDGATGCAATTSSDVKSDEKMHSELSTPGVTYLDPDYMNEGIAVLSDESRRRLENTARLLGLTREAVA
ncbi:MAG: hypothetical protein J5923_03965 [Acidaminococcaceae bacterium]|nr:hypothetical protein [Acidaminococcaceae bacterium]